MMRRFLITSIVVLLCAGAAFRLGRHWALTPVSNPGPPPAWEAEKAELEAALAKALARPLAPQVQPAEPPAQLSPDPGHLLKELGGLAAGPGPGQGPAVRRALGLLGQLADAGPAAFPAIADFLNSNRDMIYSPATGKAARDPRLLSDAAVPVSLRMGLFDVLRQVGGEGAEKILGETLTGSRAGVEVAYLTEILEQIAPGKYQELALNSARNLLNGGASPTVGSVTIVTEGSLPSFDRDFLFGVLRRFSDPSFATTAQAQLLGVNGQLDRGALRYLQEILGEQSVAIAAQAYQDSRLTEPAAKEGLARLALAYVGGNDQAVQLWHRAILDPSLLPDQKRNLVEDLNEDGLQNKKVPTPEDLQLIARRYALTQAYLQQEYVLKDKVLNAAFHEADKDLRNLLQRGSPAVK